jgi:PHD/YefM family antitoxin component YafN of YafNO toxin-antitoxin module
MNLHPQVIQKNGINEFVVLPYQEYERLRELAEDYEDLRDLREAIDKERTAPSLSLAEVRHALDLE